MHSRTARGHLVQATKGIDPGLAEGILNDSRERNLNRPSGSTILLVNPVNTEVVESCLVSRGKKRITLLVVGSKLSPIPASISKFSPGIYIGLCGSNEGLAIDSRGPTKDLALRLLD